MNRKRNRKAFTIVELVIVIAVIAILATTLVPTFGNVISNAQEAAAKQEAKNAFTSYMIQHPEHAGSLFVYEADGRYVAIKNGAPVGVYDNQSAALVALELDPRAVLTNTGDGKLFAYGGEVPTPSQPKDTWDTVEQLVTGFDAVKTPATGSITDCHSQNMPFAYSDLTLFENTTITELTLYVTGKVQLTNGQGAALEADTMYDYNIYVIDANTVKADGAYSAYTSGRKYTLSVKGDAINGVGWYTFDVSHLGITVGEGETLGFGDSETTLGTKYLANNSTLTYWGRHNSDGSKISYRGTNSLLVGVTGIDHAKGELQDILKGKYLSVFGASMCTYDGYSNDTTNNNTIGSNAQYYGMPGSGCAVTSLTVEDTFWMQLINELDMELLVNNSWSGSRILDNRLDAAGYNTRPTQLHANTGSLNGTKPDVIVSFMGNNDYGDSSIAVGTVNDALYTSVDSYIKEGKTDKPGTFAEGYAIMVAKMAKAYPNAKIFLFNMRVSGNKSLEDAEKYNAVINAIADHYGCYVVDLTHSIMRGTNFSNFAFDAMHPNAAGMDVWTELVIDAMKECYLS